MICCWEEVKILLSMLIPLLGAVGIYLARNNPNRREAVTLITSIILLIVVFSMVPPLLEGNYYAIRFMEILPGIAIEFRVEPLGMSFAVVAALLWPINSLYSIGYMRGNKEKKQTRFYICFALALFGAMGISFSGNLVTMFIFYELLTLSTYPLVTHKGNRLARKSGRVYLGILMGTSIGLLFPAIVWTWYLTGTTSFIDGGILGGKLEGPLLGFLLFLFVYGIGKAALMPVHRWLPAAMVAPTPVSALLHAVAVVKAGVFAVLKVIVYIFGIETLSSEASAQWLMYVACFTIIVASTIALRRDNLKKRLAYSTISQLAYVVLGAAILAPVSAMGAAIHITAHAFGKITLFFAAGAIYTASHKTNVSQLDGIGKRMPWTMGAFAVGAISMIGVPPAAGFLSKWYILMGAFETDKLLAVAVIIGSTLLSAAYFLPIVYAAFFKPEKKDPDHPIEHGEAPWPMVVAIVLTASFTILVFLFHQVPLDLAQQMVRR